MALFNCAVGPHTQVNSKGIQCDVCGKRSSSWRALCHHYIGVHFNDAEMVASHFIGQQAQLEKAKSVAFTEEEFQHVAPTDDLKVFHCVPCDKALAKCSAVRHFTTKHQHPEHVVRTWVVSKDAHAIENKRLYMVCLHHCHKEFMDSLVAVGPQGGGGGPVIGADEDDVSEEVQHSDCLEIDVPSADEPMPGEEPLWKKCWVLHTPGGIPVSPLQLRYIDDDEGAPAGKPEPQEQPAAVPTTPPPQSVDEQIQRHAHHSGASLRLVAKAPPGHVRAPFYPHSAPGDPSSSSGQGQQIAALGSVIEALSAQITKAHEEKPEELVVPEITISQTALEWVFVDNRKEKNRWPFPKHEVTWISYDGFGNYLQKNKNLSDGTQGEHLLSVQRLFGNIFEPTEDPEPGTDGKEPLNFIAVLVALAKSDLLDRLDNLPLMNLSHGWAQSNVYALQWLVRFGEYHAEKHDMDRTLKTMRRLLTDTMEPWTVRARIARNVRRGIREEIDGLRLEGLPPAEFAKEAVYISFCNLALLSERAHANGSLTVKEKFAANAALAGAIIYGTFAGRSGEWHKMRRDKVIDRLTNGDSILKCSKHKTAKFFGAIAKWIPDGLSRAILVYAQLPGKHSDKLFEPARESGAKKRKCFTFGPALRAFGKQYTPKYVTPRVNLMRKMFHSVLVRNSREGPLLEAIGKADGHSAKMGLRTYALSSPRADATTGELVYRLVFGDPVEWPTPEALAEKKTKQRLDLVIARTGATMNEVAAFGKEEGHSDDDNFDEVETASWSATGQCLIAISDTQLTDPICDGQQIGDAAGSKGVKRTTGITRLGKMAGSLKRARSGQGEFSCGQPVQEGAPAGMEGHVAAPINAEGEAVAQRLALVAAGPQGGSGEAEQVQQAQPLHNLPSRGRPRPFDPYPVAKAWLVKYLEQHHSDVGDKRMSEFVREVISAAYSQEAWSEGVFTYEEVRQFVRTWQKTAKDLD